MIHAYLFVKDKNSEREEHGPKFHSHMYRINHAAGTNITVKFNPLLLFNFTLDS